jgi:hypothetical protein
MAPRAKAKRIRKQSEIQRVIRKSKFQADLAPAEDRMVRSLKEELELSSNTDFLSDALALFRWAVLERKRGRRIFSGKSCCFPDWNAWRRHSRSRMLRSPGHRVSWKALQSLQRENRPLLQTR